MDIFKGRYFNINRRAFLLIGLWPYAIRTKTILRVFFITSIVVLSIPQLTSAIVHRKNLDRLMLNIVVLSTLLVICSKMSGIIIREKKIKELLECIADNWQKIQDEGEKQILIEYSETGRLLTVLYTIFMSTCAINMTLLPFLPKILDAMQPLEEPRPSTNVIDGEFFIDREEHFFLLIVLDDILIAIVMMTIIAFHTMHVVCSQHCCALYAIVRYRLRNLKRMVHNESSTGENDHSYEWMRQIIQMHKMVLDFTTTLDDSFSVTFLLVVTIYLILIPFVACSIIANLGNPLNYIPYLSLFGILAVNLFVTIWPGQTILDEGLKLCDDAHCNEWYTTPIRTKKLLLILMQRSSQPILLSAGGLVPLIYETYFQIMRTAVSYITVVASFR